MVITDDHPPPRSNAHLHRKRVSVGLPKILRGAAVVPEARNQICTAQTKIYSRRSAAPHPRLIASGLHAAGRPAVADRIAAPGPFHPPPLPVSIWPS
jgi:hypothetical protein